VERSNRSGREKTSTHSVRDRFGPTGEDRISKYIRPEAVIHLSVDTKADLLRSLAEVVLPKADGATIERVYQAIIERENAVNSYVGNGVAIPHARVDCVERFAIAIARNPNGFPFGIDTDQPVQLVVLIVGNETLQNEHVQLLSAIASALVDREIRDRILDTTDPNAVIRILESRRAPRRRARPLTQLLMSHAQKIAREMGVTAILVNIGSLEELALLQRLPRRRKFIVATSSPQLAESAEQLVDRVLILPKVSFSQASSVRLSALMALSHGLIQRGDVVAFLTGNSGEGLDTMTIVEVGKQFGRYVSAGGIVGPGILPAVIERVITIAAELGAEGREGRPVGTIFVVVGEEEPVGPHVQQMVMNPFRGYPENERNVMDPTLTETIKEFASIDGAFVIRGDGVVISAGTFLKVDRDVDLPGGYGSRHRAAAAFTKTVDCAAVALSQSSGVVTLFRSGSPMLTLDHRAGVVS
jgi:diadenylate cyclase